MKYLHAMAGKIETTAYSFGDTTFEHEVKLGGTNG
jgi:hypothetical protein